MQMKKILCSLCFVWGMGSMAMAQTQAGNIFMGTSLGWNNTEYTSSVTNSSGTIGSQEQKNSNISIQPMIGTFVSNNLALGLFASYEQARNESIYPDVSNNSSNKMNAYTVGPFIRKFFPLNEKFALYGQGNLGYSHSSTRFEPEIVGSVFSINSKYNSFSAALRPGIVFFATSKIGVDLSVQGLQYSIGKEKNSSRSISNFNADFYFPNLNIGVNIYLNR